METRLVIPSELGAAKEAERRLLAEVARFGYSEAATFAIKLALEEAINNAIKHGNKLDPSKPVEVRFEVGPAEAVIVVSDQGDGFDPCSLPDPTADENLEKPTGRGVMLMRAYMDEIRYNAKGNQVLMRKHNS